MAGISPKKKITKSVRNTRHSTRERLQLKKLSNKYSVSKCNNCGKPKLSHRVCPHC